MLNDVISVPDPDEQLKPVQYRQPIFNYPGRVLDQDNLESVSYIPGSHIRLWYNNQPCAYAEHHHDAAEIIYIQQNVYPVRVGREHFDLRPGDILYIPPHMPHTLEGGSGVRFILLLDPSPFLLFSDFKASTSFTMGIRYLNETHEKQYYTLFRETYDQVIQLYFQANPMWELHIFSCMFDMFMKTSEIRLTASHSFDPSTGNASLVNYGKFSALLNYINDNYCENLTLEKAADYVGFSKYHFLRMFTEYTGLTFHEYLLRRRIQVSQSLLTTDKTITDIAFESGFNSITSFSRSFRQYTGMSPTEYRAKKDTYDNKGYSKSVIPSHSQEPLRQ